MTLSDQPLVASSDRSDLVIHIGELRSSNLISHYIAPNRRILCASPAFIELYGLPAHPQDLATLPTIALHENNEDVTLWQLRSRRTTVNIRTQPILISNDGEVIRQWAVEGLGVIMRSEWDVADALAEGKLLPLLPDANVVVLTHQGAGLPERTRAFMRMMQEQFQPQAPWRQRLQAAARVSLSSPRAGEIFFLYIVVFGYWWAVEVEKIIIYQNDFISNIYYTANTFHRAHLRCATWLCYSTGAILPNGRFSRYVSGQK